MTQYLTHPPTITPSGAFRPVLIEQDLDELVLEENCKEEFYSGNLQAARARVTGRVAGAAEPFMVTIDGFEEAADSLIR